MSNRLPVVALLLGALAWGGTGALPAQAAAAARVLTPACPDVNLRTATSTGAPIRARLSPGSTVTVIASVPGARWATDCGGWVAGSRWLRISHVDGLPVRTAFGVPYLYAAAGLLRATAAAPGAPATPAPVPAPTPTPTPAPVPAPTPAPIVGGTGGAVPVADAAVDPLGAELMRLINLDRLALGLAPYPIDPTLAAIARDAPFPCPSNPSMIISGRARDLALRSYLTHTVPGCLSPGSGIAFRSLDIVRTVFRYTGVRSEILHWNTRGFGRTTYLTGCDIDARNCRGTVTPSVQAVALAQRSFMSSSPHRRSELNTYERFGCGSAVVPGTTRTYFACLFSNGGPPGSTLITAPSDPTVPVAPTPIPPPAPTPIPPPAPTPIPPPAPTPIPPPGPTPTPAPAGPAPAPTAATAGIAMTPACTDVNLRSGTSTSTAVRTRIQPGTVVTAFGIVQGSAWATECPGPVAGNTWYQVSHVDGTSVQTLFGVPFVYAATGVLAAAPTG